MADDRKITRVIETVSWAEVQPLLNRLANAGKNERDVAREIGLSASAFSAARGEGKIRKVIKVALDGLVARLSGKVDRAFSLDFEETAMLFDSVRALRAANPGSTKDLSRKKMQSKLALHMAMLAEGEG